MRRFYQDSKGFSTLMDLLLFLALVSASGVILLPTITGNTQIKTALETNSQRHSSEILLTLLNGRVDDFEYAIAGTQMDSAVNKTLGEKAVNSSIYQSTKKLLAGHEMKHKTFADLASENAASQFTVYHNNSKITLNFLLEEYKNNLNLALEDYLETQVGDRYHYNLTIIWRPITGVPMGGDVRLGRPVPESAYVESAYITIPYHTKYTREYADALVGDNLNRIREKYNLSKDDPLNRSTLETIIVEEVHKALNKTVDIAVSETVNTSIKIAIEGARNKLIEQVDNLASNNTDLGLEIQEAVNNSLENETWFKEAEGEFSDKLTRYLQRVAEKEVYNAAHEEIQEMVSELMDEFLAEKITLEEIKERILNEIYSRINISRAKITLAIWEKRR